ncbi:hypothetical protein SLA2020_249170 [Shorea laevis]
MVAGIATILAAVFGPITTAIMGILMPEVSREVEYCRTLKENKKTLIKRVEELNVLKYDIELRRRNIRRGKMMKKEVEHWLSRVQTINEEVEVVKRLCSAISRGCFANAWLGKTVLGKIDEVKELCRQHGNFSGDIVIDRPSTSEAKLLFLAVKKNAKKLIGKTMPAVSRKLEYCRNPTKNMNTLGEGLAELNQLKDDIVELRRRNIRRGKMMKKEVEHWLSRVQAINEEVEVVKRLCSAISRFSLAKAWLGKTVLGNIDEVQKLCEEGKSFGDILIDRTSTSGANKMKHALEWLNRQKEEVERRKSRHENAGKVVREEVNDWLIDVTCINAVIQILEDASCRVSLCDKHKFNEIVLEKSHAVNILRQRGTFPDGIVIDNRRKPKRG